MVEVHDQRNLGIKFGGGQHQVIQILVLRIGARATAGLNDDGRTGFPGSLHDGLYLLHVIDVECADAVLTLGRFVQKLPHRN